MRRDTQIAITRSLLEQLRRKQPLRADAVDSVPAAHYTSVEHLEQERATILSTWPQLVALSTDVPGPGSFVVRDRPGSSVIVSRDEEGRVHALANVCRHRGARVAEGRGDGRRLSCPYHAWSYRLDGSLAAIPDRESFPGVDDGRCRLPQLPVVEWAGMIWVVPSTDSAGHSEERLRADLGHIGDDLVAYDIGQYAYWRSHRFELDLNWKLVVDTFLEPYHFSSLHRNTVGPIFVSNLCTADRAGHHVREVLPRKSIVTLADLPESAWDLVTHSAIVYALFPNTVLVVQVDHLETWRVQPRAGDPSRSICDLDFYIPAGGLAENGERYWERNWELTINTVIHEDFKAMAGVQANLASGHLDRLTFGRNEPALALFHQALADGMAADPTPRGLPQFPIATSSG